MELQGVKPCNDIWVAIGKETVFDKGSVQHDNAMPEKNI